ncbi:hypothetical protein [Mongoliitalea lutea]|uniref:hypothetical protein n=1 Tax=Mongoliitalea lutea TaxID=849756 RepID=UPI00167226DE|nr:hypothetical protein [Mongoliitalea lutea]
MNKKNPDSERVKPFNSRGCNPWSQMHLVSKTPDPERVELFGEDFFFELSNVFDSWFS